MRCICLTRCIRLVKRIRLAGHVGRHAVVGFDLWVGQKAHRRADTEYRGKHDQPERGLFVCQHRLYAALHRRLAESKRTGAHAVPWPAQVQQRLGIARALRDVHCAYHALVAGELDVAAEQRIGQPDQRVVPVCGQNEPAQRLYDVVTARDVRPLVRQHLRKRAAVKAEGQVYPGPEEPQYKGGIDALAFKGISLEPDRLSDPPPQPQIACQRPEQHDRRTRQPDHRREGQQHLQRVDARGGARGESARKDRVNRLVQHAETGVKLRLGVGHDAPRQGLGAGDEAQGALNAHRQHQPQADDRPQQQPEPLRRLFEQDAEHNDDKNKPARGDAHVHCLDEYVSHLHRPPCIRLSSAASRRARCPRAAGVL